MMKNAKKVSAMLLASSLVFSNAVFAEEAAAVDPVYMSLEVAVSDSAAELIGAFAGQDISWLKNAKIEANASVEGKQEAVEFLAALNESPVMNGLAVVDLENMVELVQIKELGDMFFKVNMNEMMGEAQGQIQGITAAAVDAEGAGDASAALEALQDEELQAALLQNYALPFLGTVNMTSVEDEEITYKDNTATISYTGVSTNFGKLADVVAGELETLKTDDTVLGMINEVASNGEITPEMLDQAIQAINNVKENGNLDSYNGKAMYGMSEDGNAMGGYLEVETEDGSATAAMKVAQFVAFNTENGLVGEAYAGTDDENYGVMFEIGETYNFVLTANHQGIIEVNAEIGENSGNITIKPVVEEGALLADFDGFEIDITYAGEENSGNAIIDVVYAEESLFTMTANVAPGNEVEFPDTTDAEIIEINDEAAMEALGEKINPEALINNLLAAGVPESFLSGEEAE